ncbi:outer membrane lipoprotein chaperone LolA [Oleiagrimonas soli]|uniref:Outer-membrane lipoprotein carrier protein n=1 Tax=Oleiagrimonas soli TaxID=1543381 RepID=A0A099CUH8_9GAMM|nr:outer membrane lipoprotein chaperone LolA [Oleiagrimonas soli]KGI77434.1 cell envelope biogenesis protein LolA [Oleiagrimonas soli]MBB6183124.1 outer membrane lipoprotein carrier protein [Oleiagrimonas soli]
MKIRFATLLLTLCLVPLASQAAQTARARLDAFAHDLHALRGDFTQTLTDANGRSGQTSQGTVALQAPRQFRWQTKTPYQQLIVADGSHVWTYDPDLEQVTVQAQSLQEAHSPLTVLTDPGRLDKEFKVTELGTRDGLQWLQLSPRDNAQNIQSAQLGFDANGLAEMQFTDRLGAKSVIRFSHWQRNPPMSSALFTFTPPKGADVIGDTSGVPEVHPLGGS